MQKIAYQGVPGSFSHLTALNRYGTSCSLIGVRRFREIYDLLEKGEAHIGVIPIENSLAGSVHENYDLLDKYDVRIVGEAYTRIEHCLLAVQDKNLTDAERIKQIRNVYSHPKALEQCLKLFEDHPWLVPVIHEDTAGAAADLAKSGDRHNAAIASRSAAQLYGLQVLMNNIEDCPSNYTRFVFVTKNEGDRKTKATRCSLIVRLKHSPGTLYHFLEKFAKNQVNLTKIESRPLKGTHFEYIFYVDFEFSESEIDKIQNLLKEISAETELLKVLGLY